MRAGTVRLLCLAVCLTTAAPVFSQVGHPAKGSWSGYWGPSESDRKRILLLLDWVGNEIIGTINPGPNAVEIKQTKLDVSTWTLTIEADMPFRDGTYGHYVATGNLKNLGSWTNRRYSGTYRHGDESGTFLLTLN